MGTFGPDPYPHHKIFELAIDMHAVRSYDGEMQFSAYQIEGFYDEMFETQGTPLKRDCCPHHSLPLPWAES